jgi:methylase of polypeptide subunit release factors
VAVYGATHGVPNLHAVINSQYACTLVLYAKNGTYIYEYDTHVIVESITDNECVYSPNAEYRKINLEAFDGFFRYTN